MREKYSEGNHGAIYFATEREKKYFGPVGMVREEIQTEQSHSLFLFYGYKIAGLLFPDSFLKVHAVQQCRLPLSRTTDHRGEPYEKQEFLHRLFSEKASIKDEHAIYSSHMESIGGFKDSVCGCSSCLDHRSFHEVNEIERQTEELVWKVEKAGISLPVDDPSDYCLTENGILFFEMSGFQPEKTEEYLRKKEILTQKESQALRLVKHYRELQDKTGIKIDPFSGESLQKWDTEDYIV